MLPPFFAKIIGPYELRAYWFEIFECFRKLSLVGLPVFFMPGSLEQIVLGLIICFISFGAYMAIAPYRFDQHDRLSQICQAQIFFTCVRRNQTRGVSLPSGAVGRVQSVSKIGIPSLSKIGIPSLS